jgi:branched-subunit amino acid ABC-type transport system permease component
VQGYEMRMTGLNREFSRYGGINVATYVVLPMVLSGALHGLAGGLAIQRGLVNRILEAPHEMQILLMLGVALVMENGALMLFGPDPQRVNTSYGLNQFVDNGDQTITDQAAGLMWTKADSGVGMNWSNALAWVQAKNAANFLGHNDWRLPPMNRKISSGHT